MQLRIKRRSPAHGLISSVLAGVALFGACSSSEEPRSCPDEVPPTFSITVRAHAGPLPADTILTLRYGGGVEVYDLAQPATQHSVLFCDPKPTAHGVGGNGGEAGAGGAAGAPASSATDRLTCDVWVEGAATIEVSGGGYPALSQQLEGEANDCGPETVEEELILGEVSTNSDDE
ncbi:MAG TPA: hypothetical protein VI197_03645 [Polyangiaceae bacterium]